MSMREVWNWVSFFSRIVGSLMVSSTFVGLAMNWWDTTNSALVFCYAGLFLLLAGLLIEWLLKKGRDTLN